MLIHTLDIRNLKGLSWSVCDRDIRVADQLDFVEHLYIASDFVVLFMLIFKF